MTSTLKKTYHELIEDPLNLDLTRGKPSTEQLNLSSGMLSISSFISMDGIDCRNYGGLEGLSEARELFGEYLDAPADNTYVLGNSSLSVMHDTVLQSYLASSTLKPSIICPVPGYDRHFAVCQQYGIRMISVPLTETGPDMDVVKEVIRENEVLGMWCVPKYSNPTGITYSDEVCAELASMEAPNEFRILWDLAYQVHDLTDTPAELPSMLELCNKAGNADRVFMFGSTSKITFAGSGLAILAASSANLSWVKNWMEKQSIGPDKLNQLHHVEFLRNMDGVRALMAKHREIIAPKFKIVDDVLTEHFDDGEIVSWTKPNGGYFIDLKVKPGCAERIVQLAGNVGVKLTPAGAAFPYGIDPNDMHIRIAPTAPLEDEVRQALKVLVLCIKLAAREK